MNNKEQTKTTYNNSNQQLITKFNSIGARVSDIDKAFSYISKDKPKVLELGCGSGRDAVEILKRTDEYIGIDFSEKFIEECKSRINPDKFQVGDLETFNYPSDIDIIFAFASLLHSDKEAMKNILLLHYSYI